MIMRHSPEDSSQSLFESFFHQCGVALFILDGSSPPKFRVVNQAMAELVGARDPRELVGRCPREFHEIPEEGARIEHQLRSAPPGSSGKQLPQQTILVRSLDGSRRWLSVVGRSVLNEDGSLQSVMGAAMDVTHHMQAEEEGLEEFLRMEKLNSLSLMAGGLAHDFNNILTVITGYLSLAMQDGRLSSTTHTRLDRAHHAAIKARDLTDKLLTLSRGGGSILATASLEALIQESIGLTLSGSDIQVNLSLDRSLWPCTFDATQMMQVFNNLLLNARQAISGLGTVAVLARNRTLEPGDSPILPPGFYVEIVVQDSGPGVPEDHLGRLFDPYFTTKSGGSGLGLATSFAIIRKHGGTLDYCGDGAAPPEGIGAQFRILLPATPPRRDEEGEEPPP